MSLHLYLDYCAYSKRLVSDLKAAGHQVKTPPEVGIAQEADDSVHFRRAADEGSVLLTKDAEDFEELHQGDKSHAGILVIREDAIRSRNMNFADIVRAIANIEKAKIPIAGEFLILNAWRYLSD